MPDSPARIDTTEKLERICQTCGLNPRDHPIHCIQIASPEPPAYQPRIPSSATSTKPAGLPRRWPRLQTPRPALRFDVASHSERRPRVRARRLDFSPLSPATTINDADFGWTAYTSGSSTPVDEPDRMKQNNLHLRLPTVSVRRSQSSERSPSSESLAQAEKGEAPPTESSHQHASNVKQMFGKKAIMPWRLELASWLLSALCMCTIVAVLFLFQHRSLPKRWIMNITLNAYISILSRAASASLLLPVSEALGQLKWSRFHSRSKMSDFQVFDDASRGPWGSILLISRTKGTALATLGAIVTICTMAMDPFFQQVVRYPQRMVMQGEDSTIARAVRIDESFYLKTGVFENMTPNQGMKAIIDPYFSGFEALRVENVSGTHPDITFSCPTSDCTWESYETLGVCAECVDIADMGLLDFGCYPARRDWNQDSTQYIPYDNGAMCGWFFNITSDMRMLMLGYEVDPLNGTTGEILMTRTLGLIGNVNRKTLWNGSLNFPHIRNPIYNFVIVSPDAQDGDSALESIFRHEKPQATECVLSWCVQKLNSSYHDGIYTEIVEDRFVNTTTGPFPWWFDTPDGPNTTDSMGKMRYSQDIIVDPHAASGLGDASSYGLSNDTAVNVIVIFDDYLPSFYTRKNNGSTTILKNMFWEKSPYLLEDPNNLWLEPYNITDQMNRLATKMTNFLRQWGNETSTGKTFIRETYIEVHWEWLTLPISILVLTLIFLLSTIRRTVTDGDHVGVWKNSAIATLLYGLPNELQWKLTERNRKFDSRIKEPKSRLRPAKKWWMSGNTLSPTVEKPRSGPNRI